MSKAAEARQPAVNEVPLSKELQKDLDKFLYGVNEEYDATAAFVIVFRPGKGYTVDANVASWALAEEIETRITKAIAKALKGEPLFYSYNNRLERTEPAARWNGGTSASK